MEKISKFSGIHKNKILSQFPTNLVCSRMYGKNKIHKLDRNQPSSYRLRKIGNLVVPVNNTFVCHTSFLAVLIMAKVWLPVNYFYRCLLYEIMYC